MLFSSEPDPAKHLATPRDFLRWAISTFNAANIVYGHGTTKALDEAAFLILEGLHLPIDELEPFLDAQLLPDERAHLTRLVRARVETRKPAAYLLQRAYVGGVPFYVDERVIVPRSFIGELLQGGLLTESADALLTDPDGITRVLDLCTGSGCLAILAAYAFPAAQVDAVDLSPDALAVARRNVSDSGADARIALFEGDLFAPLADTRYDLIVTNPPYVGAQVMAALPPEYAHEPALALAGGENGLDVVRRILDDAPGHLTAQGGMLCEIGEDRAILEAEYPHLPFLWLDTAESSGEVFWLPATAFALKKKPNARAGTPARRPRATAAGAASAVASAKPRSRRR